MKNNKNTEMAKKIKKALVFLVSLAVMVTLVTVPAFAAGVDESLTKFNDFMFGAARLIGVGVCLWGIIQLAISIKQHDGAAKVQGILELLGGLLIVFAKELLQLIGVSF